MQLIFSTLLKGIIRKECQSFTNHGHAKTPLTVFNPLSLWLTLPRDIGVSHTLWPPGITRAILACLWFAQGLHKAQKKSKQQSHSCVPVVCTGVAQDSKKIKRAEPFYDVQGGSMSSILLIGATYFSQHHLRALSAKNANHLQTTDTLKRHQRYSIHYHCG